MKKVILICDNCGIERITELEQIPNVTLQDELDKIKEREDDFHRRSRSWSRYEYLPSIGINIPPRP